MERSIAASSNWPRRRMLSRMAAYFWSKGERGGVGGGGPPVPRPCKLPGCLGQLPEHLTAHPAHDGEHLDVAAFGPDAPRVVEGQMDFARRPRPGRAMGRGLATQRHHKIEDPLDQLVHMLRALAG